MTLLKCKICFSNAPRLSPELVASGYKAPKDMKCPICDTLHNGATGQTLAEWDKEAEIRTSRIRQGLLADPQYYTPDKWK